DAGSSSVQSYHGFPTRASDDYASGQQMIRTKIIATLGPACSDVETLVRLLQAGVDVCRLNFSHGTLDKHAQTLSHVRQAAKQFGEPIAVLGDLGGPKIRVGEVRDESNRGGVAIEVGDELVIQRQSI